MKKLIIIFFILLVLPAQALATWTLAPSLVSEAGHYVKWKVVCTSDGSALSATDILSEMGERLLERVQGQTAMLMKVEPGAGGVIPDTTINVTLTDAEDDTLWSDTGISKDTVSWHLLSADISAYPPVLSEFNLTLNDIGGSGDQVTLYFIMWRE